MRVVLLCLVIASPALAAPHVRWIDKTGGVKSSAVVRTRGEEKGMALLVLPGDKDVDIPIRALLEWVRENDTIEEQKKLLEARIAVQAGTETGAHVAALGRLAKNGTQPWIKEYASAFRAVAGLRRSEKDAVARADSFLKKWAQSRFAGDVILARAHHKAARVTRPKDQIGVYFLAFAEAVKAGGPVRSQFRCLDAAAPTNAKHAFIEGDRYRDLVRAQVKKAYPKPDLLVLTIRMSAETDFELADLAYREQNVFRAGHSLDGMVATYKLMAGRSDLLLPATQAEPWFRIGRIEFQRGNVKAAKEAFAKARALDKSLVLAEKIRAVQRVPE